ncbi:hypothetical protein SG34_022465 [Thalassomonas viridans]|uniref:Uncharacterized protein n=1 Tax=Thalassomonas viridans TaxID=137584 RepID=A0AAF0C870_9GAMM|nr:hypothetical protein [Thalassomonas viridans]WDE04096.1 hypothetical protein SG34_022465 [Thalassomonas viridans]
MSYSPVASALIALSACQDSAVLQIAKASSQEKKAYLQRQEAKIMCCFLDLLGELSVDDQEQVLKVIKVET